METLIRQLIADSMEQGWPELLRREGALVELPDMASVLIGMRRTGKTYRLFQRMRELVDGGVDRHRILYLNFEDERLGTIDADFLRADSRPRRGFPNASGGSFCKGTSISSYCAMWLSAMD